MRTSAARCECSGLKSTAQDTQLIHRALRYESIISSEPFVSSEADNRQEACASFEEFRERRVNAYGKRYYNLDALIVADIFQLKNPLPSQYLLFNCTEN